MLCQADRCPLRVWIRVCLYHLCFQPSNDVRMVCCSCLHHRSSSRFCCAASWCVDPADGSSLWDVCSLLTLHPSPPTNPARDDESMIDDAVPASLQVQTWLIQQLTDLPAVQRLVAVACMLKHHSAPATCPGQVPLRSQSLSRAVDFHHVNAAYTALFARLHESVPHDAIWSSQERAAVSRWCEYGSDIIEAAKVSPIPLPADVTVAAAAFIHRCKLGVPASAPAACPVCASGMTGGWQSGPSPLTLVCTAGHVSSMCAGTLDVIDDVCGVLTCRCCGAGMNSEVLSGAATGLYPLVSQFLLSCMVCGCTL
jgi:hypothetical protein